MVTPKPIPPFPRPIPKPNPMPVNPPAPVVVPNVGAIVQTADDVYSVTKTLVEAGNISYLQTRLANLLTALGLDPGVVTEIISAWTASPGMQQYTDKLNARIASIQVILTALGISS